MFKRAERKKAKLRLAFDGPSGSGKTYSALLVAKGLCPNGRIAVIDTENGSAELYADVAEYDTAPLAPPYTPERYLELIRGAENAGYDVLIIDSLSHAWAGEGGILEMHDRAAQSGRSGNSYTAWRDVTPWHNKLVDAILHANCHVIITMRTKTAYEMVDDGHGKKKPVKIGLAPVQRDGMEYEFTLVLDLSVEKHIATASKDRTRLFDGKHFVPSAETGSALRAWLSTGRDVDEESRLLLEKCQSEVALVGSAEQLEDWWVSHGAELARLNPTHLDTLKDACGARNAELQQSIAQ